MINQRIPMKRIACDKEIVGIARGKVLYLRREGSSDRGGDYFKILSTVGEGGSCVCYDAMLLGEKKIGRLKEFYPLECSDGNVSFALTRASRNHVVAADGTDESFVSVRQEFVESYHLLRDVMNKNKNNSDFTSFIPDFSIYYACDEQGNFVKGSTAYIWTEPENLTVFEEYIDDVHKHPSAYPEHKLFTILKTILTLTECIKILHENGLLHLDIKPGNFGIPQRNEKLLTDSVTLFDVNSIYSLKSAFTTDYGTFGFSAPEIAKGRADITSDIYSIGCTLFSALVTGTEEGSVGYSRKYYTKIAQLIDESKIITASELNSGVFLKHELVTILKKCLAESQSKRYQSCVELVGDLENALAYLYPAEINAKLPKGKRLVILDREPDKKRGISSCPNYRADIDGKRGCSKANCEFSEGDPEALGAFHRDYQKLWDRAYRGGEGVWKKLCEVLAAYHKAADTFITFKKDIARKEGCVKYRFIVPASFYTGICNMISAFVDDGIFDKASEVCFYTTDSCEVNIYAPESVKKEIKRLISDPFVLGQPENIEFVKSQDRVSMVFDNLRVERFDLQNIQKKDGADDAAELIIKLLQSLENDFAFVTGFTQDPNNKYMISFTYATKRIKKLLTDASNILDIYVYHR